jgi:hypothetical protein
MCLYAFLKGLTVRKHKNKKKQKKFFFSLKYMTLINPYTNHKNMLFKNHRQKEQPKMPNLKIAFF